MKTNIRFLVTATTLILLQSSTHRNVNAQAAAPNWSGEFYGMHPPRLEIKRNGIELATLEIPNDVFFSVEADDRNRKMSPTAPGRIEFHGNRRIRVLHRTEANPSTEPTPAREMMTGARVIVETEDADVTMQRLSPETAITADSPGRPSSN